MIETAAERLKLVEPASVPPLDPARAVLVAEFPELAALAIHLPDEQSRRVGQAIAAASLPACA
jgi:hypothetical protein